MKRLFLLLGFLSLFIGASSAFDVVNTQSILTSSPIVYGLDISSTPTKVDPDSLALSPRSFIAIQNQDTSIDIVCSTSSSLYDSGKVNGWIIYHHGGSFAMNLPYEDQRKKGTRIYLWCAAMTTDSSVVRVS